MNKRDAGQKQVSMPKQASATKKPKKQRDVKRQGGQPSRVRGGRAGEKRFGVSSLYRLMGRTSLPVAAAYAPKWHVIDAEGLVLGRVASSIAVLLRGKHKPWFTPFLPCGDKVIVINAEKVALTGRKWQDKKFYWHTGYPGGINMRRAKDVIDGKRPERLLIKAVERMMKHGPLGRKLMKNLYVYCGAEHPHHAAQPQTINFGERHVKNKPRSLRVS